MFTGPQHTLTLRGNLRFSEVMPTDGDTGLKLVVPKLQVVDWDNEPPSIAAQAGKPDADPFDLLCPLALNASVLTRRQPLRSGGATTKSNKDTTLL
jgi:hypothetical protein